MSGRTSGDSCEFGVLFVAGFAEQRPGSAIASLASALYRWLFRWNSRPHLRPAPPPALSDAVLSGAAGTGDEPAHLTLDVPLRLSSGEREARWLLAESSWADLFTPPQFLGVARWIWKVSTCLLVLQFVIPMRRHWHRARPTRPSRGTDGWELACRDERQERGDRPSNWDPNWTVTIDTFKNLIQSRSDGSPGITR